jgi:hypothetical protein
MSDPSADPYRHNSVYTDFLIVCLLKGAYADCTGASSDGPQFREGGET